MTENHTAQADAAVGDEFSYLPGQAERLGAPLPTVRRLHVALPDGRTISALRFGDARPRVVLLHGAGLNAHTWDTTVLALRAPALVLDLPGHGDSSWRDDADYRPRTLAPDVIRAVEEWADAPVALVGHSLGGLTAAAVAAARPDLVATLHLIDITPGAAGGQGSAELRRFYEKTVFDSREAVVERAMAFGLGGSPEDTRRGVFHNTRVLPAGPDGKTSVEWKHHFARLAQQALAAPAAPATAAAPLIDHSGWDDLAAVAAPVTLVRGTRGFVDEAAAEEFAARLPSATTVTLDAPHNVQEVAPGALAALIAATPEAGAEHPPSDAQHPHAPHPADATARTAQDPTAGTP